MFNLNILNNKISKIEFYRDVFKHLSILLSLITLWLISTEALIVEMSIINILNIGVGISFLLHLYFQNKVNSLNKIQSYERKKSCKKN